MILQILFLLSCPICTWWLLPLLLISWLLGLLFWHLFYKKRYVNRIKKLEGEVVRLSGLASNLEKDLINKKYDYDTVDGEFRDLQSRNASLEMELKAYRDTTGSAPLMAAAPIVVAAAVEDEGGVDLDKLVEKETELALEFESVEEEGLEITDLNERSIGVEENTKEENLVEVAEIVEEPIQEEIVEEMEAEAPKEIEILKEESIEPEEEQQFYANKIQDEKAFIVPPPPTSVPPKPAPPVEPKNEPAPKPEPKPELKPQPKTGMGAMFQSNNLQIIEGVGPKIEGLLKGAGFTTWAAVGDASLEELQQVLDDAGPRYRVHKPNSWAAQAKLAANGRWEELVKYQKFLDTSMVGGTPSKVEKLYAKKIGFAAFKTNDLKIIEGIGPKIEGLLQAAGIDTWEKLANTNIQRVQMVLDNAGDRYRLADPTTWPQQAMFASKSQWAELKKYQNTLSGGK